MSAERSGPRVLVVDDEAPLRYTLRAILEDDGVQVVEAADGRAGLATVDRGGVDLVITDLKMPGLSGLELLDALSERAGGPRAIMVTAHGSERMAVEAMKRGALDYFAKPFDPDEVIRVVRRALESVRLREDNRRLRAELALGKTMIFSSGALSRVAELVERVAPRDVTVLITGESGTGKELVAKAIVRASRRVKRPYVRFNAAALSPELVEAELFGHARGAFTGAERARPGLFREAEGGTLLIDEVGELLPRAQSALLRVLQEREVRPVGEERSVAIDVRLLAATHRDLAAEVKAGRFREDLYYRLKVVELRVPPLRERPEDIRPLADHFTRRFADRFGLGEVRLSDRLMEGLEARPWPGNVRELENTIERLVALSTSPLIDDDPFGSDAPAQLDEPLELPLKERVAAFERGIVSQTLAACHHNHSEAARRLGMNRVTLLDKLKRLGLA